MRIINSVWLVINKTNWKDSFVDSTSVWKLRCVIFSWLWWRCGAAREVDTQHPVSWLNWLFMREYCKIITYYPSPKPSPNFPLKEIYHSIKLPLHPFCSKGLQRFLSSWSSSCATMAQLICYQFCVFATTTA